MYICMLTLSGIALFHLFFLTAQLCPPAVLLSLAQIRPFSHQPLQSNTTVQMNLAQIA